MSLFILRGRCGFFAYGTQRQSCVTQFSTLVCHSSHSWEYPQTAFIEEGTLSELDDPKWLIDLAFLADITKELNTLNLKLQSLGYLVTAAFENVTASPQKSGYGKPSSLRIKVISQHVSLLWRMAQHSAVRKMLMTLRWYSRN